MGKIILITTGMFALLMLCWNILINDIKQDVKKIETKVGLRVVLEKDTLMVIDYSYVNDNYTLSSGIEVSRELVDKLQIIK